MTVLTQKSKRCLPVITAMLSVGGLTSGTLAAHSSTEAPPPPPPTNAPPPPPPTNVDHSPDAVKTTILHDSRLAGAQQQGGQSAYQTLLRSGTLVGKVVRFGASSTQEKSAPLYLSRTLRRTPVSFGASSTQQKSAPVAETAKAPAAQFPNVGTYAKRFSEGSAPNQSKVQPVNEHKSLANVTPLAERKLQLEKALDNDSSPPRSPPQSLTDLPNVEEIRSRFENVGSEQNTSQTTDEENQQGVDVANVTRKFENIISGAATIGGSAVGPSTVGQLRDKFEKLAK